MLVSSREISITGVRCYCFINILNLTSSTRSICRAISQYAKICGILCCLEHMKFTVSYISVYFRRHHTITCKALAQKHYFDSTWTYLFVLVIHRKCYGGAHGSLRQQLLNTSFSAPWRYEKPEKVSGFGLRSRDLIVARLKSFVYFNILTTIIFDWRFFIELLALCYFLRATRICTIHIRRYQHGAREHKITWHEHTDK